MSQFPNQLNCEGPVHADLEFNNGSQGAFRYEELKTKLAGVLKYMDASVHCAGAIKNLAFGIFKDYIPDVVSSIDLGANLRARVNLATDAVRISSGDLSPETWVSAIRSAITLCIDRAKIAWVLAAQIKTKTLVFVQSNNMLTDLRVRLDLSVSENEYYELMRDIISLYIVMEVNHLIRGNEIDKVAFSDIIKEFFND